MNKSLITKLIISCIFILSCGETLQDKEINLQTEDAIVAGQNLRVSYNTNLKFEKVSLSLLENNKTVEYYGEQQFNNSFFINRIINVSLNRNKKYFLEAKFYNKNNLETKRLPLQIEASIIVKSLCATENCLSLTGNVIEGVNNTLHVDLFKIAATKIKYHVITPYENYEVENVYNSPVTVDWLNNIRLKKVPKDISSYIAIVNIEAFDNHGLSTETSLPFKVVRPLEVKHYGKYELAEVYEPVPVTGCIPGTVGNNVQYSESQSETRQNSVSTTLNRNWSNSLSSNSSQTNSEGINVGETSSTILSSSLQESETQSESLSNTYSKSEGSNLQFNTTDGENWSWSLGETNSNTQGNSNTNSSNNNISGGVTTGVSGEGSLPFLAKASGKVEVSAGVSRGWGESNSQSESNTQSDTRGYSTGGSSQNGKSYGSVQNEVRGHSLTGAYVLSSSASNTVSESTSLSSGRVWNMSESLSSGKVITEGNSESLSQTIVTSESSSTTFSYSGYIPRGRFGMFHRQTSRYVKLSEIISYDLNGYPSHAGFIMMNTWAWAPDLSIGNSCDEVLNSSLPKAECLIPPCGE